LVSDKEVKGADRAIVGSRPAGQKGLGRSAAAARLAVGGDGDLFALVVLA
jgi:hypothetical protein